MFKKVPLIILALVAVTVLWVIVSPTFVSAKSEAAKDKPSLSTGTEKFSAAIVAINKDKDASKALARAVKAKDMKAATRIMRVHGFDGSPQLKVGGGGNNCICYGAPSHPTCYCLDNDQFSIRD